MSQYRHIRCTVADHGLVISDEDYQSYPVMRERLQQMPDSDWYISLFKFPEEFKQYFEKHNSVKGYNGPASSNRLTWDLDSEQDPDQARKDAIELLKRLQNEGVVVNNSVEAFYSGAKGMHIELAIDQEVTPDVMKAVCSEVAKGLVTFDGVIYNTTRCYRIPNTKHNKTRLYKIPLEPDELIDLDISKIRILAQQKRVYQFKPIPFKAAELISKYNRITKPNLTIVKSTFNPNQPNTNGIRGLDKIDWRKCPKNIPRCIYALQFGICKPGERQIVLFRLATYYRNQGLPKEVTGRMLKGIAELNARLYPESPHISKEEVWQQAVASAYKEGGNFKLIPGAVGISAEDSILQKYCECLPTNIKCILHHRDAVRDTTVQIDEVADWFSEFAKSYDKNIVRTGIAFFDDHLRMQIGTTYHLVGCNGSGKTTTMLNTFENSGKLGQYSVFFSLDMDKRMVYLKLATRLTDYTQTQVIQFYRENNIAKMAEIKKAIAEKYNKTFFDFSATLSLEQMRDKVLTIEERTKNKMNLVVVDFAGRISGPYSDKYANACYNALKASEMAKSTDSTWLFIHQISRSNGDVYTPLRSRRVIKESGDWEDNAAGIINIWRPYSGIPSKDNVMRAFICKNKMGSELEGLLLWDGAKSIVRDMTEDELVEYDHPEDEIKILKERIVR